MPKTNLSGHDVHFIKKVKEHFSNLKLPKRISEDRPFYEYFMPISSYKNIENVYEVDLNAAYWQAALNLGYITDELFNLAFSGKVSKKRC